MPFYILGVLCPFLPFRFEFPRTYFGANHHVCCSCSLETYCTLAPRGSEALTRPFDHVCIHKTLCADASQGPFARLTGWESSVSHVLFSWNLSDIRSCPPWLVCACCFCCLLSQHHHFLALLFYFRLCGQLQGSFDITISFQVFPCFLATTQHPWWVSNILFPFPAVSWGGLGAGCASSHMAVTDFRLGYKYGEMFSNHPSMQPFVSVYVCVSLSWSMLCLLVLATPRVPGRPHKVCLLLSASQFLLTYPSNPSIFFWCLQTAKSCSCMRQTCYRNQNPFIQAFVCQQSLG